MTSTDRTSRRACGATLLLLAATAGSPAQVQWTQVTSLRGGRVLNAMATDTARGRVVLVEGRRNTGYLCDTWEWDGSVWSARPSAVRPPAREYYALAYDVGRGVTLLFGNDVISIGYAAATWEWNGSDWTQRVSAVKPPSRAGHALAHDQVRGRTVLFGGGTPAGLIGDTWEWDGTSWTQRLVTGPSARGGHGMTFDAARGRILLFGGVGASGDLGDTWDYDGTAWRQLTPAASPSARYDHAMAYDPVRARVVLQGGTITLANGNGAANAETWEWDGTAWSQRTLTGPGARSTHAMAFDPIRARLVAFGGSTVRIPGAHDLSDAWSWDGTSWMLDVPHQTAWGRRDHALAYDGARDRVVLFSGTYGNLFADDTWEWGDQGWTLMSPTARPSPRGGHAMVWHAARGRVLLFGGGTQYASFGDVWEWDGSQWSLGSGVGAPRARYYHALAYDTRRQQVVLFGGDGYRGQFLDDTWSWDGNGWSQRLPANRPTARCLHGMAYDQARDRVVLFGGWNNATLTDTWEWDGTDWPRRTPLNSPPHRGRLAYDSARSRTVLFSWSGTWEWDGSDWLQRSPGQGPRSLDVVVVEHTRRGRLFHFGSNYDNGDAREYGPVHPASHEPYGAGCSGSGGVPLLMAAGGARPWLGDRFPVELTALPASGVAVLLVGRSRTAWNGFTLPLPLDPLGLTGCALLASGEVLLPLGFTGGRALADLLIPNDPSLLRATVYEQAVVHDPPANPGGFTLSNGGSSRLGGR